MFFATLSRVFSAILDLLEKKDPSLEELENVPADFWSAMINPRKISEDSLAFFPYKEEKIKKAVLAIKTKNNKKILNAIAAVASEALIEELSELKLWRDFNPTFIVGIPASDRSKLFNQSEEIAKAMIHHGIGCEITLLKKTLVKTRKTPIQHSLPREKRLKNLRGSMNVTNKNKIQGVDILVIDDVTTTGATFEEATRALKEAGARKIFCIALAH